MFKNLGGNIPGGNFLVGNFPGRNFPGGSLMGWNFPGWSFPGGSFPDTFQNMSRWNENFKEHRNLIQFKTFLS